MTGFSHFELTNTNLLYQKKVVICLHDRDLLTAHDTVLAQRFSIIYIYKRQLNAEYGKAVFAYLNQFKPVFLHSALTMNGYEYLFGRGVRREHGSSFQFRKRREEIYTRFLRM